MWRRPEILTKSCKEVRNKLKLLKDFGICGEQLIKLLMRRASILSLSLEQRHIPTVTFLLNLYQSQDLFIKSVVRYTSILILSIKKTLKPSVALWEGLGLRRGARQTFSLEAGHSTLHLFVDWTARSHSENRYRKR